jgi:hypothetical protein
LDRHELVAGLGVDDPAQVRLDQLRVPADRRRQRQDHDVAAGRARSRRVRGLGGRLAGLVDDHAVDLAERDGALGGREQRLAALDRRRVALARARRARTRPTRTSRSR